VEPVFKIPDSTAWIFGNTTAETRVAALAAEQSHAQEPFEVLFAGISKPYISKDGKWEKLPLCDTSVIITGLETKTGEVAINLHTSGHSIANVIINELSSIYAVDDNSIILCASVSCMRFR
jgi:hypothetical protein